MPNFIDEVISSVSDIMSEGMSFVEDDLRHDADKTLLRKLDRHYGTLSLEDTLQIWDTLGHRADETPPCKVCKLIASKEHDLAEDLQ